MLLKLLKGIRHFKNHQYQEKKTRFTLLSKGQSPDVLFITCSDSRVEPTLFTHTDVGDLFVIRNAGNIIAPFSSMPSGEAATLEFALTHLKISEIIICGHSHCGAMKGLLTPHLEKTLPSTASWISYSKPVLKDLHKRHPELRENAALELLQVTQDNVLLQIEHLKTHPHVVARLKEGTLNIHAWYYEFETGEIFIYNLSKDVFQNFEHTVEELAEKHFNRIIKEESLTHIKFLTHPTNAKDFKNLLRVMSILKQGHIEAFWDQIKLPVEKRMEQEVGELYLDSDNQLNPEFYKLLTKGAALLFSDSCSLLHAIEKSLFYNSSFLSNLSLFKNSPDKWSISGSAPKAKL